MEEFKEFLSIASAIIGVCDAIVKKRYQVLLTSVGLAILIMSIPIENGLFADKTNSKTYQQVKTELIDNPNLSDIEAYLIDLNADGLDEMVVTYKNNKVPSLSIYYTKQENVVQLYNKTATISPINENPTLCYMITKEQQGYSLRERITEENGARNTYYKFENNSLVAIRDIYEGENYSDVIDDLESYPVIITTDPIRYAIEEGMVQPPKI